ncbi:MAG TPA: type I-F CRISPR-associated helicase Cas3, partial [Oceanospirillales bacterium]|nr:type I-F CRISPR-associated helicase Cas3 [Oceanospirillales bacterium]
GDIKNYFKDGIDKGNNHPLIELSPFAQLVAWLILTHHKLPIYPDWKDEYNDAPNLTVINNWFTINFEALWNSHNCKDKELKQLIEQNWKFNDLPTKSIEWLRKARKLADNALKSLNLLNENISWLNDNIFTSHISRMCLMLADHYFSSQDKTIDKWRDNNYQVYANTHRRKKDSKQKPKLKQQLDEHLIGVACHSKKIVTALPKLNSSLNQLTNKETIKFLNGKVEKEDFIWQDKAKDEVKKLRKETIEKGFFGINMASTGKGKTIANAKIMYSLTKKTGRVRFNVALGLRTLTLQTGKEFKRLLKLQDEDIAIAVGGIAVKQLFENEQTQVDENQLNTGSESEEQILDSDYNFHYKGEIKQHSLREWTKHDERIDQLLQAPVLVSTIDHLIPATEGTKGGKQIAPMLRLLTSDLIIDEPDDFGLGDLPALCRLVNWAGMLGSRVLLSTATMPPALSYALFIAYKDGWEQYAKANLADWNNEIACAWFDENSTKTELINNSDDFQKLHNKFVSKRVKFLDSQSNHNKIAKIVTIEKAEDETISSAMAKTIQENIITLHRN